MQFQAVRELARGRGIRPGKLNKLKLIRVIQVNEGNFDCFATAKSGYCDQQDCLWRDDCFMLAKKALSN